MIAWLSASMSSPAAFRSATALVASIVMAAYMRNRKFYEVSNCKRRFAALLLLFRGVRRPEVASGEVYQTHQRGFKPHAFDMITIDTALKIILSTYTFSSSYGGRFHLGS